ncbi:ATP-dependent Clp protease proteolytic subunit [Chryseobacterium culicis]|uniref:ATP-dependent Clp protease proteolytic subunit n=1 Tax=Chryseobacterium culicis TaxID=680127 RepID=UPI001877332E|nr:ATP-dependent Clp protease proteolytic subunit [Chryseobacterium culicis]MBE4949902.1 ATP-dependent Clp protease proteolytic subunit [Chryseobacterium culicis]
MKHEIKLYGEIINLVWAEESFLYIDVEYVDQELSKLSVSPRDEVVFNIHSLGGDTAVAFAIYNKIRRFGKENKVKITTRIDGYCASSGVILLLAGDRRIGNRYAEPFVHNAWTFIMGDKEEASQAYEELEKTDNMIASLYEERTNITKDKALEMMAGNTWISAEECLEYGFYTELENEDSTKPILNSEKQIIFNSIQRPRNNSINNKMTQEENSLLTEIKNLFKNKKVPSKNAMLYTDNQEEVVFAELNEGEKPKVGDAATINGKNASGTVNMADGSVYSFEAGKVTEIKEKEGVIETVTLNSINEKLENLITENKDLKNKLDTQNSTINDLKGRLSKVDDFEETFNKLKNLVGQNGVGVENEPKRPVEPAVSTSKNRFENFKLKNSN